MDPLPHVHFVNEFRVLVSFLGAVLWVMGTAAATLADALQGEAYKTPTVRTIHVLPDATYRITA